MSVTEAAQEERTVRKDQELRLVKYFALSTTHLSRVNYGQQFQREISLGDAKSKLDTAQETIRRLLAEKSGNGGDKSMVDLRVTSEVNFLTTRDQRVY
jgi:hypothetical protein